MITSLIHQRKESEDNSPWKDSPYKELLDLTIDGRGWVGEQICSLSCKTSDKISIEEDVSDVNEKGANTHYDIKINGEYIEIKTAYRDKSNSWQHENIYKNSSFCDRVLFIDFDYDGIRVSMFKTVELPLGISAPLFPNKHATLRQNKDDGYKLDFSRRTFDNFKGNHYKFFTAKEATYENIGKFIASEMKG